MVDLNRDELGALEKGEPVPCVLGSTECVVLRRDVFERMRRVAYDDSEWTAEEMIALAERAFDDADIAGPII